MSNVPAGEIGNTAKNTNGFARCSFIAASFYTVGITRNMREELLGDMRFVDLPEVGATVSAGDDCAVAESVKSGVNAPVSGAKSWR